MDACRDDCGEVTVGQRCFIAICFFEPVAHLGNPTRSRVLLPGFVLRGKVWMAV
jgi:hypothetical protein